MKIVHQVNFYKETKVVIVYEKFLLKRYEITKGLKFLNNFYNYNNFERKNNERVNLETWDF